MTHCSLTVLILIYSHQARLLCHDADMLCHHFYYSVRHSFCHVMLSVLFISTLGGKCHYNYLSIHLSMCPSVPINLD